MLDAAEKAVTEASRVLGREGEVRERREREGEKKTTRGRGDWSATGVTSTAPERPRGSPPGPRVSPRPPPAAALGEEGRGSPSRKQHKRRPPLASPSSAPHRLFLIPRVAASPRLPRKPPNGVCPPSRAPRPLPAPPRTPNSFTRRRPHPARARRVGTRAGAQGGWSSPYLSPAPGSHRASGPRRAFSARTALAPSPKWRGPGVLAEQPPQPPPPPPPPPQPLCLRRRGRRRRLGKSSSEHTDEFGKGVRGGSGRGRCGKREEREPARAAGDEEEAGPGRAGPGRAGLAEEERGPGRRRKAVAEGGGARPAQREGLSGVSAGGAAGPTRRPAPRLSPQSQTGSRRFGPWPALGRPHAHQRDTISDAAATLSGPHREAAKPRQPSGSAYTCAHSFTVIYCMDINVQSPNAGGRDRAVSPSPWGFLILAGYKFHEGKDF
ncbi:atherin-like [Pteropus medius]|uniref:atherin-like n=1 Tax=Pteropus vampyrus TaxID=132908 RepID=UPI00196B3ABB|nr:atherin-like [Pteropus giganteus]